MPIPLCIPPASRERVLLIVCAVLFIAVWASNPRGRLGWDFQAFYCGGQAVANGADPYRIEPLRACERSVDPQLGEVVLPAPLPGYDLAVFGFLSRLTYRQAEMLAYALIWVSILGAAAAVRSYSALPLSVICMTFLFSAGAPAFTTGPLALCSLLGITSAAAFASRKRYAFAAAGATVAMCEPHLGLGAVLALLLFVPGARPVALAGLFLLGAVTYAETGAAVTLEYVRSVLPLQAASEISHHGQYSLTHVLHFFGAPDAVALALGGASYGVMLCGGLLIAVRLRRVIRDDAVFVVVPVAFTLVGGAYLHVQQIALALPCALLLYTHLPRFRRVTRWALVLLAVPFLVPTENQTPLEPYVGLGILALAWYFSDTLVAGCVAALTHVTAFALRVRAYRADHHVVKAPHMDFTPSMFAQEAWNVVSSVAFGTHPVLYLLLCVPTWCGLGMLVWTATVAAGEEVAV